jgi:hypothetical protein
MACTWKADIYVQIMDKQAPWSISIGVEDLV